MLQRYIFDVVVNRHFQTLYYPLVYMRGVGTFNIKQAQDATFEKQLMLLVAIVFLETNLAACKDLVPGKVAGTRSGLT